MYDPPDLHKALPRKEVAPHGGSLGSMADRLRRAGNNGRWPSNVERDSMRTLTAAWGPETWLHAY